MSWECQLSSPTGLPHSQQLRPSPSHCCRGSLTPCPGSPSSPTRLSLLAPVPAWQPDFGHLARTAHQPGHLPSCVWSALAANGGNPRLSGWKRQPPSPTPTASQCQLSTRQKNTRWLPAPRAFPEEKFNLIYILLGTLITKMWPLEKVKRSISSQFLAGPGLQNKKIHVPYSLHKTRF